jgi:hypothetical protein
MGKKGTRRRKKKRKRGSGGETPARRSASQDASDDFRRAVTGTVKLVQLAVAITSLLVVVNLVAAAPGYAESASALAGAIVVYDLGDLFNWRRIRYLRERELWPLIVAYVCCLLAMSGVCVAGLMAEGSWWLGAIVVGALLPALIARHAVETQICSELRTLRLDLGRPLWGGDHIRARIEQLLDHFASDRGKSGGTQVIRTVAETLVAGLRGPLGSARRLVAHAAMIGALLLACWSSVAVGREAIHAVQGSTPSVAHAQPSTSAATTPSTTKAPPAPPASSAGAAESPPPLSHCAVPPGTGAPAWAHEDIFNLYLGGQTGAQESPGTDIAGCPVRYHTLHTLDGEFIYTIGESPTGTQALSVAVDSSRFGPALFLGSAVKPVVALIGQLGAVGGLRSFTVGPGQFYPVQTDRGTYILIRRRAGASGAEPYAVIPPTVAQAWVGAVLRSKKFLWPTPSSRDGRQWRFDTGSTPPEAAYSFTFNPPGMAEPELSEAELASVAAQPE